MVLTPEMVNAQFSLIDTRISTPDADKNKKEQDLFPYGNRMPPTNIPVSLHGFVPRSVTRGALNDKNYLKAIFAKMLFRFQRRFLFFKAFCLDSRIFLLFTFLKTNLKIFIFLFKKSNAYTKYRNENFFIKMNFQPSNRPLFTKFDNSIAEFFLNNIQLLLKKGIIPTLKNL